MKILVMGFTKIKYMPYMNFYLQNIDADQHEVHILYWNRDLQEETIGQYSGYTFHEFLSYQEDDVSPVFKIRNFIKYRQFAKRVIHKEKFDYIFVLHSLPAVLIADVLRKQYPGRYIFDYRDSTYEGFAPFKRIVGQIVGDSVATFVSSDAFRRFLPAQYESKIYTSHNLLTDSLSHRDEKEKYGVPSDKIRIAFWGFIRHETLNKEIIRKLAGDPRFELHYYGREQQVALNLKQYVKEIDGKNVFFHGEYTPEERYTFVRSTDLIHNLYHDENTMLAMGNKYYDGVIFKIPQLCMRGSFMAEKVERGNVGLACDPNEPDFADKIYAYYQQLDFQKLASCCDDELREICREYDAGVAIIKSSIC